MAKLADLRAPEQRAAGVRIVLDARPLQEPARAPITAQYLERLLAAFAARPLDGESFVLLLRLLRDDPTEAFERDGLVVAARRKLPPTTRTFRSAGLTVDSFLLRAASVRGTAAGGEAAEISSGAVFHTAGGAVPIRSGVPIVATLLDLAPWELPERYARSAAARFGHRLRARNLRDARRVITPARATADAAVALLGLRPEQMEVVPLAADPAFNPGAAQPAIVSDLRTRFDLPDRYLVFAGRYDARKDLGTLFEALAGLRQEPAPRARSSKSGMKAWPPVVVLAGAGGTEHEEAPAVARAARRAGVADMVRLTPRLAPAELAALEAASIGHVQPAVADGTGLAVLEALAIGVPVIASRVGALPEIVGTAGIVVEPRDPPRMATAIRALWEDGAVARQVTRAAAARAGATQRTWADVAEDTRRVYAEAAGPA